MSKRTATQQDTTTEQRHCRRDEEEEEEEAAENVFVVAIGGKQKKLFSLPLPLASLRALSFSSATRYDKVVCERECVRALWDKRVPRKTTTLSLSLFFSCMCEQFFFFKHLASFFFASGEKREENPREVEKKTLFSIQFFFLCAFSLVMPASSSSSPLPLSGVVAMTVTAASTAGEEAARLRLAEKLDEAGARVVARASSRVSHAVVLLPPGASSSATALKQCITPDELRSLHERLAGVIFFHLWRREREREKERKHRRRRKRNKKRRRRPSIRVFFSSSSADVDFFFFFSFLLQTPKCTNRLVLLRTSSLLLGSTRAGRLGRGSR